jgi:hypothetical protein
MAHERLQSLLDSVAAAAETEFQIEKLRRLAANLPARSGVPEEVGRMAYWVNNLQFGLTHELAKFSSNMSDCLAGIRAELLARQADGVDISEFDFLFDRPRALAKPEAKS